MSDNGLEYDQDSSTHLGSPFLTSTCTHTNMEMCPQSQHLTGTVVRSTELVLFFIHLLVSLCCWWSVFSSEFYFLPHLFIFFFKKILWSDCRVCVRLVLGSAPACVCVCKMRRFSVCVCVFFKAPLTDMLCRSECVCMPVCLQLCECVRGMKVSDYPVASPRPHGETSGLTWMRSSRSSQGTLPWTR